jgi:K+-sensing histidine kinase KdpD
MQQKPDLALYLAVGPVAAVLMGLGLIPFRSFTSASNFTFFFIILTIVVAEYGGSRAAVSTALTSALSLDFFLTQPYLRITIADKHDLIAFCGLALCGLVTAAFSSARAHHLAELKSARRLLDLYHSAIASLESTENGESQVWKLLESIRSACPLTAAAIRDARNSIVAVSQMKDLGSHVPTHTLSLQTLLPPATDNSSPAPDKFALPKQGVRVPLVLHDRQLGWLDLYGNGTTASAEARRALCDLSFVFASLLAGNESSRQGDRHHMRASEHRDVGDESVDGSKSDRSKTK